MDEVLPQDTAEWLLAEMAANRTKPAGKVYSQVQLRVALKGGAPMQPLWGAPNLTERLVAEPDLLLPNATLA